MKKFILDFFSENVDNVLSRFIIDKDERQKIRSELMLEAMAHERSFVEASRDIIISESKSESWVTKSWRPLVMLSFAGIIVYQTIMGGLADVPEQMWSLLTTGLGGYTIGRSAEKIAKDISPIFTKGKV